MTSIFNVIPIQQEQTPAEVGMGATMLMWTDRHAYTIIEVAKNGKSFVMQQDTARRTDNNGMSECQTWDFTRNPEGAKVTVRMSKKGWRVGGMKGNKVLVGVRDEHFDFSF